ncbi:PepSY domain-containing protein [Vreelandella jeotgali]|uniref:PepSY domain-containing protein n=1 Tax=Vreelandella jeotgali TaxID=553386 RepID=UPI0003480816|nr:PepSY domain-containing protein [Halomonas jeotgali]
MKTPLIFAAALAATLTAVVGHADDDCHDPVADWQPRDTLRQALEASGWDVRRIKVDDGCYEARGQDAHGNDVEAKYAPASLHLRKLELEISPGATLPDGLERYRIREQTDAD